MKAPDYTKSASKAVARSPLILSAVLEDPDEQLARATKLVQKSRKTAFPLTMATTASGWELYAFDFPGQTHAEDWNSITIRSHQEFCIKEPVGGRVTDIILFPD